jgi:WD40 repeat protein
MKMLKITQLTLISLMIVFGLFRSPVMAQPSSGINRIVWSPDGTKLAGASFAGPIYIWDRAGQLVQTLPGHNDASISVSWNTNGNLLASSGIDGYDELIKVWDMPTGALVQTLSRFVDGVGHIAFSPNGDRLIGTGFSEVKVWDTTTWEIAAEPPIGTINDVKWSPDGTMIAFAAVAGINVVDATTYQLLVYSKIKPLPLVVVQVIGSTGTFICSCTKNVRSAVMFTNSREQVTSLVVFLP